MGGCGQYTCWCWLLYLVVRIAFVFNSVVIVVFMIGFVVLLLFVVLDSWLGVLISSVVYVWSVLLNCCLVFVCLLVGCCFIAAACFAWLTGMVGVLVIWVCWVRVVGLRAGLLGLGILVLAVTCGGLVRCVAWFAIMLNFGMFGGW